MRKKIKTRIKYVKTYQVNKITHNRLPSKFKIKKILLFRCNFIGDDLTDIDNLKKNTAFLSY